MNLPNKITLTRIFMIPIFVALFFITAIPCNYLIAAIVFTLAAFTDALDGHIARSRGLVTNLGKFLDPIADKVLVSTAMMLLLCMQNTLFFIFGGAAYAIYVATAVCVCVIMARELIISAFRQIAATTGLVMAADKLGKYKTVFQDVSIALILGGASFATSTAGAIVCYVGFALFAVATILTVVSGISYVVKNKQVLKDSEKEGKETSAENTEATENTEAELDPVYIEGLKLAITSDKVTISMLQRKLSIGFNKAGRIIEWMEENKYIAEFDGTPTPRKVLISKEEFEEKFGKI